MRWIGQQEQPNGFYLIEVEQDDDTERPVNFAVTDGEQQALLFKQQGNKLLFMTEQAFPEPATLQPKNTQAWVFLKELTATLSPSQPVLITGSNPAMATVFHLANVLKPAFDVRAVLASESGFPFVIKPARFLFPDFPPHAIGAATLLEDWQVPNRLCSEAALPGCFDGRLGDLWSQWTPPRDWQLIDCDRLRPGD